MTTETVEKEVEQTAEQAEESLKAGFNKVRPETPAPDTALTPEPAAEETPAPVVATPAATPAVPNPVDTRLAAYDARMRKMEGHIGGLNSKLTDALAAAKAATAAGSQAPTSEQITAAPVGSPKWKQLKEDFPEWGEGVEELFAGQAAEIATIKKSIPASVDVEGMQARIAAAEQKAAAAEEKAAAAEEKALVRTVHRDFVQVVNSSEFRTWMAQQPPENQALAESASADDAIKLIDSFKEHQATAVQAAARVQKQNSRLAAAAPVKGTSVGQPRTLPDEAGLSVGFHKVRPQAQARS